MIVGIGIDVCNVNRLAATLRRVPGVAQRVFTEAERGLPVESLAARFAAKEAVAKALGAPPGLRWQDAEIVRGEHGRPVLVVRGSVAECAARLGVASWQVSLSHDDPVAVAMVVALAGSASG